MAGQSPEVVRQRGCDDTDQENRLKAGDHRVVGPSLLLQKEQQRAPDAHPGEKTGEAGEPGLSVQGDDQQNRADRSRQAQPPLGSVEERRPGGVVGAVAAGDQPQVSPEEGLPDLGRKREQVDTEERDRGSERNRLGPPRSSPVALADQPEDLRNQEQGEEVGGLHANRQTGGDSHARREASTDLASGASHPAQHQVGQRHHGEQVFPLAEHRVPQVHRRDAGPREAGHLPHAGSGPRTHQQQAGGERGGRRQQRHEDLVAGDDVEVEEPGDADRDQVEIPDHRRVDLDDVQVGESAVQQHLRHLQIHRRVAVEEERLAQKQAGHVQPERARRDVGEPGVPGRAGVCSLRLLRHDQPALDGGDAMDAHRIIRRWYPKSGSCC